MHTIKISEKLTVASQPDLDDFPGIARAGFSFLINNRPDGEDAAQPGSAAEQEAATAAGLGYAHVPVGGAPLTEDTIRQFQDAIESAQGPVLAHCRSGTRTANIYAIGEVLDGRMKIEDLPSFSQQLGLDLRSAQAWLAQHEAG